MNKAKIIKQIKKQCNEDRDRRIESASKLFDYMEERRVGTGSYTFIMKKHKCLYLIATHYCVCKYYNFYEGVAEFTPLISDVNIGTKYAGGILRIEF